MEKPLVSICCITYNHEHYIKDALDGFIIQKTNFPFEIVISDDCSKDRTRAIIEEYKRKFPDLFRDISPKQNLGSITNYAYVQKEAKGKYVALCEGDDYWTDPYKLQKQVDYMEAHPECGLCITDFCVQEDLDKQHISKPAFSQKHLLMPKTFEEHLLNAGYIGPMTWLYKVSERKRKSLDFNGVSDGSFALALHMFAISKVHYLPYVTAVYRVHSGSAANPSSHEKKFAYTLGVFKTQLNYASMYQCDDNLVDRLRMQNYTTLIPLALECNNRAFVDEALEYYKSKGLIMNWFVDSCNEYVKYKNLYLHIRSSKAYRLGRMLLKPFKWLGRK